MKKQDSRIPKGSFEWKETTFLMKKHQTVKSPGRRRCCWLVYRLWPGGTIVWFLRTVMMSAAARMMPLLLFPGFWCRHFTASSRQRCASSVSRWDADLDFRMRTVNLYVRRTTRLRSVDTRWRRSCDTRLLLLSFTFVHIAIMRGKVFKHWGQHVYEDSLRNLTGLFITARCCCCCWWGGRHRTYVTRARDGIESSDCQTWRWRMFPAFILLLGVLWRQRHVCRCCRRFKLCLERKNEENFLEEQKIPW